MKCNKEQRLLIGREIYSHELTIYQAAEKYGVNRYTARDYMRESRDINNLYYPIKSINEYIYFFNNKRPAYSLNYMTPIQYKVLYAN